MTIEHLSHKAHGVGRELARLHNAYIACSNCGNQRRKAELIRIVPGTDDKHYAQWLMIYATETGKIGQIGANQLGDSQVFEMRDIKINIFMNKSYLGKKCIKRRFAKICHNSRIHFGFVLYQQLFQLFEQRYTKCHILGDMTKKEILLRGKN